MHKLNTHGGARYRWLSLPEIEIQDSSSKTLSLHHALIHIKDFISNQYHAKHPLLQFNNQPISHPLLGRSLKIHNTVKLEFEIYHFEALTTFLAVFKILKKQTIFLFLNALQYKTAEILEINFHLPCAFPKTCT